MGIYTIYSDFFSHLEVISSLATVARPISAIKVNIVIRNRLDRAVRLLLLLSLLNVRYIYGVTVAVLVTFGVNHMVFMFADSFSPGLWGTVLGLCFFLREFGLTIPWL